MFNVASVGIHTFTSVHADSDIDKYNTTIDTDKHRQTFLFQQHYRVKTWMYNSDVLYQEQVSPYHHLLSAKEQKTSIHCSYCLQWSPFYFYVLNQLLCLKVYGVC